MWERANSHRRSYLCCTRCGFKGNQLSSLPENISQLTAWQKLGLDGYPPSRLPESMGQLTALQKLSLHG